MAGAKNGVMNFWSERGTFPSTNASAGVASSTSIVGSYVTGVAVGANGVVTATYGKKVNAKVNGGTCSITPRDAGGSVTWAGTCSFAEKYRSSAFR